MEVRVRGTISLIHSHIKINSAICLGKPYVPGMGYTVAMILELPASCIPHTEILDNYPYLVADDILAYLRHAAKVSDYKSMRKVNL